SQILERALQSGLRLRFLLRRSGDLPTAGHALTPHVLQPVTKVRCRKAVVAVIAFDIRADDGVDGAKVVELQGAFDEPQARTRRFAQVDDALVVVVLLEVLDRIPLRTDP